MTTGKPRVLATRHFPPDVEARLAANFDAILNPDDRTYDGPALIGAAGGCDAIMCAAGDPYPQGQQQEGAHGGERSRDPGARTAKTKRVQRTMAGG